MVESEHYLATARVIADYLAERQRPDGSFPGPDHYGVAWALWLWSSLGGRFEAAARSALQRLEAETPRSHGEFNAYALLHCRDLLPRGSAYRLLCRLRFGRRHSANWMLLRAVCRAQSASRLSQRRGALEARVALARYARGGFIADRARVRSFAYHAFCGALLADLWRTRGYRWAGLAAARAAQFIASFVLPNGDCLYVGRGQQQIFGYGALLHLLEAAAGLTGRDEFRGLADRVSGHLTGFQRPDGSFPLVLRDDEPAEPWVPRPLPGWYSYNRYGDYLPFLGCMLLKAAQANVPPLPAAAPLGRSLPQPRPLDFQVHRTARYTAVLSCPGGASTNDLAFPYLCADGASLFPCYGAEEMVPPEAVPLPFGVLADGRAYGFRDHLRYRLTDRGLKGTSALARHIRTFDFGPDGFICRDEIRFGQTCSLARFVPANFLFRNLRALPNGGHQTAYAGAAARLRLSDPASIVPDAAASASGHLIALRHSVAPFRARRGDTLSVWLEVRFP